jgi:hypothetical protein
MRTTVPSRSNLTSSIKARIRGRAVDGFCLGGCARNNYVQETGSGLVGVSVRQTRRASAMWRGLETGVCESPDLADKFRLVSLAEALSRAN